MKLKANDSVVVITGKDKGKTGTITRVYAKTNQVIVGGVNLYKRHLKRRSDKEPGGVVEVERALDASKVMLTVDGKPTRVGYKIETNGTKVRIAKKTQSVITDKKSAK